MKLLSPFLLTLCFCLLSGWSLAQSDESCSMNDCRTNVLNVSTGVDQNTGTLYTPTAPATVQDGYWDLVGVPASQNVNLGPAWVIVHNGGWTPPTTSSGWISAFDVSTNNDNNPPPADPYVFQRCFCVCEDTELTFDLQVYGDDQVANILLDGNPLIPAPPYTSLSTAHFRQGIAVNVTVPVAQGEHCLSIELRNRHGVAMGLMVDGEITGANLLTSSCCDDTGSICGFKFNDENQNGVWDSNESALSNWTIEIDDSNGFSSQQQTDQFGNYCFNNLPAGNYTVNEVNQSGWVQSFPSSPGTHAVTLAANQVVSNINFGNYEYTGCVEQQCATNVLDISSGVDQNTGTLYNATDPATVQDGFWQLTGAPSNQNVNVGPAWVIDPNTAWTTTSTSNWLSAFDVDANTTNNLPPLEPYTFERCFCVCDSTELTFDFTAYADDQVAGIFLDGNPLIPTPPYTAWSTAHFTTGIPVNVSVPVAQGRHCLSLDVRNRHGVAMGMMIDGSITGANLLVSACCDNSGGICGFKFEDTNQNGNWDTGEPALSNWTIQINGPNGFSSQQTDQFGNYCFNDLPPGSYTVSEVNQPGWTQSFPASPGVHNVFIGNNQVASNINFGNYRPQPEPCDLNAIYKVIRQEGCFVEFQDFSSIGNGNIVCTEWDFGDGTTTTGGPIVGHYYDAPGNYRVCIDVLAIVDGECCEMTYCETITVEGCEPEPCNIEVDFSYTNSNCLYQFNGQVLFANANIDAWFWEFSDGTTATGQQVSHTFSPGGYYACLAAIVKPEGEEDCCIYTICKDIPVDCKPTGEEERGRPRTSKKAETTDKSFEVYPNPAKEILQLNTALEGTYQIIIFDATGKKRYEQSSNSKTVQLNLKEMNLSAGVYIIELTKGEDRFRERFVFQK